MAIAVRPAGAPTHAVVGHNHDGRYALLGAGGGGGDIPPEYITEDELAAALAPYATDADLAAHTAAADPHSQYLLPSEADARYALASAVTALTARVGALEAQVATLQAQMTGHTHLSGTIAAAGGTAVLP